MIHKLNVLVNHDLLGAIDRARGNTPRHEFILSAITDKIAGKPESGPQPAQAPDSVTLAVRDPARLTDWEKTMVGAGDPAREQQAPSRSVLRRVREMRRDPPAEIIPLPPAQVIDWRGQITRARAGHDPAYDGAWQDRFQAVVDDARAALDRVRERRA